MIRMNFENLHSMYLVHVNKQFRKVKDKGDIEKALDGS